MRRYFPALAAALLAVSVSACGMPMGPYNAHAHDTWKRSYTISKTGDVRIANVNGAITVTGTDGSTVEVEAERRANAATDQLAQDLLPKIPINDRSTADSIFIETGRINGILIGANYEVTYTVRVPKTVTVRVTTVNGGVNVSSLAGRASARTTNGGIRAEKLTGHLDARTVNGGVRAQFDALGAGDNIMGSVNGGVRVVLPESAKASVNATWVNGGFDAHGLKFDVRDSGKRHFEGLLNGGGSSITATTVNGGITFSAPGQKDEGEDVGDIVDKQLKANGVQ